jgi:hypothetical protein
METTTSGGQECLANNVLFVRENFFLFRRKHPMKSVCLRIGIWENGDDPEDDLTKNFFSRLWPGTSGANVLEHGRERPVWSMAPESGSLEDEI